MANSRGDFDGVSIRDAYDTIRTWYQQNIDTPLEVGDTYRQASRPFVCALPAASALSDVEIVAVFREVIAGRLEWAHGAEGGVRMVEHTRAALKTSGRSYTLTPEEKSRLETSVLWPFIKR